MSWYFCNCMLTELINFLITCPVRIIYIDTDFVHCSSSTQSSTSGFLFGSNLESRVAGNVCAMQ